MSICEGSRTDCMEAIFGLTGVFVESTIIFSFLATGANVGELCSGVVSIKYIIFKNCFHIYFITYSICKRFCFSIMTAGLFSFRSCGRNPEII